LWDSESIRMIDWGVKFLSKIINGGVPCCSSICKDLTVVSSEEDAKDRFSRISFHTFQRALSLACVLIYWMSVDLTSWYCFSIIDSATNKSLLSSWIVVDTSFSRGYYLYVISLNILRPRRVSKFPSSIPTLSASVFREGWIAVSWTTRGESVTTDGCRCRV
jgi:hypothetical protein